MPLAQKPPSTPTATQPLPPVPPDYGSPDAQRRNFYAWVFYQFFYRIGWQFKMEATLMAGIVSFFTADARTAGLFTTLNNLGRNVAPLLVAPFVDSFRYKRNALLLLWSGSTLVWVLLTLYLWTPQAAERGSGIWIFGICYTLFFSLLGTVSVAQGAVLGKVVPPGVRGRAMAMGMTISGVINVAAIFLIYRVLQGGHFPEPRNYALSFSLTSVLFCLAAVAILAIREEPSPVSRRVSGLGASLRHFAGLAKANPNLRRLMVVNLAVGVLGSMLQFYALYWRRSGAVTSESMPGALMVATIFQVFWQSLASSILGRVADARGNRHVICSLLWIEGLIPIVALVLGRPPFNAHWAWYLGVYTLIGLRFPLYQLLVNYLLEVVEQREHAMALGAVNTVQLLTAPAPLVLGAVARTWGYPAAFLLGSAVGLYGAFTALGLKEVRVVGGER